MRQDKIIKIEYIDIDYCSLGEVNKMINTLIEKYGESATIRHISNGNDGYDDWAVFISRPETDEEMAARIHQEELDKKRREKHEREQYELLKKKFG